jgi:hypothetical protein
VLPARDILAEWQSFAGTVPSARDMDREALRDDAEQTAQSDEELREKSKGNQQTAVTRTDLAATLHEDQRFASGFDQHEKPSIRRCANRRDASRSRELFTGILGHDLRTPPHIIYRRSVKSGSSGIRGDSVV